MPAVELGARSYEPLECLIIVLCVDLYSVNTEK